MVSMSTKTSYENEALYMYRNVAAEASLDAKRKFTQLRRA